MRNAGTGPRASGVDRASAPEKCDRSAHHARDRERVMHAGGGRAPDARPCGSTDLCRGTGPPVDARHTGSPNRFRSWLIESVPRDKETGGTGKRAPCLKGEKIPFQELAGQVKSMHEREEGTGFPKDLRAIQPPTNNRHSRRPAAESRSIPEAPACSSLFRQKLSQSGGGLIAVDRAGGHSQG